MLKSVYLTNEQLIAAAKHAGVDVPDDAKPRAIHPGSVELTWNEPVVFNAPPPKGEVDGR